MIEYTYGNLLEAQTQALVNTVNCVGAMGKGLALQFKQAFPENFRLYVNACNANKVQIGSMFVVETDTMLSPKYIINFPTKNHWKAPSKISYIEQGLQDLVRIINEYSISSVAIPPLGCGNGGLSWQVVEPLIIKAFEDVPHIKVLLYPPQPAPNVKSMRVDKKLQQLTVSRALLLKLMDSYQHQGYDLSKLEVQKLAYFLQAAGEQLRLKYEANQYGPYAENLNHVLQRLEGTYIQGYGDRTQRSAIHLLPHAVQTADKTLENVPESLSRLERVSNLIQGFETPYGLELLATVHWVVQEQAGLTLEDVVQTVHTWSPRKQHLFTEFHITAAWKQLQQQAWINLQVQYQDHQIFGDRSFPAWER